MSPRLPGPAACGLLARLFTLLGLGAVLGAQEPARTPLSPVALPGAVRIGADVDLAGSFSLRACIRLEGPVAGLPALLTNMEWDDGEVVDFTSNNAYGLGRSTKGRPGFAISVLPDGAWTFHAGDGEQQIAHRPDAVVEPLADGRWHEVGFAVDRELGVVHLYHDGRRVALHDLQGVDGLGSGEDAIALGSPLLDAAVDSVPPRLAIADVRLEAGVATPADVAAGFAARLGAAAATAKAAAWDGGPLRVLAWNIWHGGRRKGRDEGVQRVVDVIRASGADLVLMQETYGSGPRIAGRLGFEFFLRSSNLSVMSRFPIVDVHRLYQGFRFGGVTVELRPGVQVQAYSLWIHHLPSVQEQLEEGATGEQLAAAEMVTRGAEIRGILEVLLPHLARTPDVPVIVGGDFNSGSHLDWTPAAAHLENHQGRVVRWPVSAAMAAAGFADTYRVAHPDPVAMPGHTWSPEFPQAHQDRIDHVYVRGEAWRVRGARILDTHPRGWPSDHAASLAILELQR